MTYKDCKKILLKRDNLMPYMKSSNFNTIDIFSFTKSERNLKENYDLVVFVDNDKSEKILYNKYNFDSFDIDIKDF